VDKAAEEHLAQARSDPYDSHPPDNQRIAALAAMPDATPEGGASAPASTLVDGIDGIEPFLLIGTLRPGIQLRQIRWQDAGTYAMLPVYVDRVRRQAHLLRDYTVGWLPELVGYADRLGQSEASAAGRQLTPDQVRTLGVGLAGAALTCALASSGWTTESMPGRPVLMRRGDQTMEPFVEANRLARGELDAEAWRRRCSDLGIRDLPFTAG